MERDIFTHHRAQGVLCGLAYQGHSESGPVALRISLGPGIPLGRGGLALFQSRPNRRTDEPRRAERVVEVVVELLFSVREAVVVGDAGTERWLRVSDGA